MKLESLFEKQASGGKMYRLRKLVRYLFDQYVTRKDELPVFNDVAYFHKRKFPWNNLTAAEQQKAERILDHGKHINDKDMEHYVKQSKPLP